MTISVCQKDTRCFSYQEKQNYKYKAVKLRLYKANEELVQQIYTIGRDIQLELAEPLDAGDYLIYVKFHWEKKDWIRYVVSCYGHSIVEFGDDATAEVQFDA